MGGTPGLKPRDTNRSANCRPYAGNRPTGGPADEEARTSMPEPLIVIGAGPVGQTAALLLARRGLPVIVLDRRTARDAAGSKAICQQRDVLDIWASVGAEAIADEGVTWTTARTYYREQELFSWTFAERGHSPLPPFVNISQSRTEELLDACIAADPRIEVRWAHEVVALDQKRGNGLGVGGAGGTGTGSGEGRRGVTVTCANGAVLHTPYVVACPGARGADVRAALGLEFPGETFDDEFLICDIRTELPGWEHERRFCFDPPWNPGRQVLIHPCPDSVHRIDWQVPPGFDLAAEEADGGLDRRIRRIVGERPYELVWRSVYRFHSRLVDRMRVGRVLVAGDGAHLLAPFGARGLNSGVADVDNAAWKLAFVLRGWAGEALLDSYHDERHAAARENVDVTAATMRFLVPHGPDQAEHRRRTLEAAAENPQSAAASIDSGRFAEPFWYADSPLTTPDPTRPCAGRPEKGRDCVPGPGVIVPDVPVTVAGRPEVSRLRQLVRGTGLTLLCGGPPDDAAADELRRAAGDVTPAPLTVANIGALDPTGTLAEALATGDDEAWLIRPDAHIAAVVPVAEPPALAAALRRVLALGPPETHERDPGPPDRHRHRRRRRRGAEPA
ncbi:FAD-dependent monooxygenase [Streptodolium elevatio]